jgi:hypothetical protein
MVHPYQRLSMALVVTVVALSSSATGIDSRERPIHLAPEASHAPSATIWRDPGRLSRTELWYGAGGKEHAPTGSFTFVKEDGEGHSPKFDVVDKDGVRWRAKVGEESKAETAASRLLWAAGYFTDEDYYVSALRVEKLPKLHRGGQFVTKDGLIHGVRLERRLEGEKRQGRWTWFHNPFRGTREFNGLRVMMALINNWDLKTVNNAVYKLKADGERYAVADLGATFGRTGDVFFRSKSNLRDYEHSKFVQKVTPEYVDFHLSARPFVLSVFDLPNYVSRTRMQGVAKHIPRSHARWIGGILGRLSKDQIEDCFLAAGYGREEAAGFAEVVRSRIGELNRL